MHFNHGNLNICTFPPLPEAPTPTLTFSTSPQPGFRPLPSFPLFVNPSLSPISAALLGYWPILSAWFCVEDHSNGRLPCHVQKIAFWGIPHDLLALTFISLSLPLQCLCDLLGRCVCVCVEGLISVSHLRPYARQSFFFITSIGCKPLNLPMTTTARNFADQSRGQQSSVGISINIKKALWLYII